MIFYRASQLKEEIQRRRQELAHLVDLKGMKDPSVLTESQKLDLQVVELQKIILKI